MKKILITILVIIVSISQMGCKTTHNITDKKKSTIQGLWIGSYTVDGIYTFAIQKCNLIIKPDGTLIYESDGAGTQHFTTGTWILKDDILTCNCTCIYGLDSNIGAEQIFTFKYNEKISALSEGTWKDVSPRTGAGTFNFTKAN